MKKLFEENEQLLLDALKADLGRPRMEGLIYDYMIPIDEIKHLIKNLPSLVKPESRGFSLTSFPSSQYVYKDPYGVVLVIGTWNYPILLTMVPVAGAIAAGNCVILKTSNISSNTGRLLSKLIPKYLDPSIVSVIGPAIEGDRHTTKALLDQRFDYIFFTGSPSVGQTIMEGAAKHLTPVTLELGGKNPVFVDKNCSIDLAAKRTIWGRMMNAGQQCIGPDYVLAHKDIIDQLAERMKYYCKELYGSDPKNNGNLGRIVGDRQMERLIGILKNHKGKVICGGNYVQSERYIEPTVLQVDFNSVAMEEETFGPIMILVAVNSMDEAINYVTSRPKPLSLYLYSNSEEMQERIINNTSAGGVTVNGTLFHAGNPNLPFGGVGASGMGAYHGVETFYTFTHRKPVLKKSVWRDFGLLSDPFFLYPPWNGTKERLLRLILG